MPKRKGPQKEKPPKGFGQRLKAARVGSGFATAAALADVIHVEHETYRRWERAETEPGLMVLKKIHEETGYSLDFIIVGTVEESPARAAQRRLEHKATSKRSGF